MLVKHRGVRRIKGAGLMDFFGSAASKVGSFIKSPTMQSIKTGIVDFANTDVGKALVSAGKDVAIAGVTGIKNKVVEAINNKTSSADAKQASKELSEYLARSLAMSNAKTSQDVSDVLTGELASLGLVDGVPSVQTTKTREPVQLAGGNAVTYGGDGINVKKVNALLKKVSGKGLSKLN